MGHGRRMIWLGLTPEPERELPVRVATLRAAPAVRPDVDAEVRRIESIILHGTQRRWLDYLVEVGALAARAVDRPDDRATRRAALDAAETVLEHHRMLIGLPGRAYARMATERAALARTVAALRDGSDSS
jgi:hypothetical protein